MAKESTPDEYRQVAYFAVDIDGTGNDADKSWTNVQLPSETLEFSETTASEDKTVRGNVGRRELSDLVLVGPVTSTRKAMLKWYQDLVKKGQGEKGLERKNVSVIAYSNKGDEIDRWDYIECALVGYQLTPLEAGPPSECQETVTIHVGEQLKKS